MPASDTPGARPDSFACRRSLQVGGRAYGYYSLTAAAENGLGDIARLPRSFKVLLENLLRHEDGRSVTREDMEGLAAWSESRSGGREIAYRPARVLMQDFTGVPAVVDLAAMRDAMAAMGGDPQKINPLSPVDLVIDHSVTVDFAGTSDAFARNVAGEFSRNDERYSFLRWGQNAFNNFRVVPPGTGICHQINLEYLAQCVWTATQGDKETAYPDTCVGTDSHTTMINGLGVLGWGVGGIEAEAVMLGKPITMLVPDVVGFRLDGVLKEGVTATDLVLRVVEMLRAEGVVGKFVEFFGPGLDHLSLPDRATIANMAPEYGATCGFFPIDAETVRFLAFTGREADQVELAEAYAREQGLWRDASSPDPVFTTTLELDMGDIEPSLAGPKRPQDRVALSGVASSFKETLAELQGTPTAREAPLADSDHGLRDGDVVIAAITSCTNTSNPKVMLTAGLLARNAVAMGLKTKPWVKASLAPGSRVVGDYLEAAGVQDDLDALGFNIVGIGCTTCIGNSGLLAEPIAKAIGEGNLAVCSVLSGNRNFEGRISPHVKANYLASPPLVVAYALAGTLTRDLLNEPLGKGDDGEGVFLKDIWPGNAEINEVLETALTPDMFRSRYGDVFEGTPEWKAVETASGQTFNWDDTSTYVKNPPYFSGMAKEASPVGDIENARILALLGDSVTTDHISPAGSIPEDGPAGAYLTERGVAVRDYNSFGARRGNHEIMMRGTFTNIRLTNEMAPGTTGGVTRHMPTGEQMTIFDAAARYAEEKVPLIVVAGKEYGAGSSRDWAAKGPMLLGVRTVIAESFERIHRSNLIGMGILPLQFKEGMDRKTLGLDGSETITLSGIAKGITPQMDITAAITGAGGKKSTVSLLCRIDTLDEVEYYRHGGILPYVLRSLLSVAEEG